MILMHRKTAGAVLAGALLCGTAACSGGTKSQEAQGDGQVAQKPVTVSPVAAVKRAVDRSAKLSSFSYRIKGQAPGAGAIEGQASMTVKPVTMKMKMKQNGAGEKAEVEMRLVGGAMYINAGKKAAAELDGKTWIKFDLSAMGKNGQNPMAGLGEQADRNPTEDSASLSEAKDLKKVGEETVDGVRTTHYAGTVPLSAMRQNLKNGDPGARQRREKAIERYEKMGIKAVTMDMWIDGTEHTKQFRTRAATDKGPLDLTATLLDYDKPVVVKAPPAAETADLAEMLKGAGSGSA